MSALSPQADTAREAHTLCNSCSVRCFQGSETTRVPRGSPEAPGGLGMARTDAVVVYEPRQTHRKRSGRPLHSVLRAYGRVMYWLPPSLVRQCITAKARVGGPRPETRPRVNLGVVPARHVYSGLFLRVQSSRNTTIDRSDQLMKGTDYCK